MQDIFSADKPILKKQKKMAAKAENFLDDRSKDHLVKKQKELESGPGRKAAYREQ